MLRTRVSNKEFFKLLHVKYEVIPIDLLLLQSPCADTFENDRNLCKKFMRFYRGVDLRMTVTKLASAGNIVNRHKTRETSQLRAAHAR